MRSTLSTLVPGKASRRSQGLLAHYRQIVRPALRDMFVISGNMVNTQVFLEPKVRLILLATEVSDSFVYRLSVVHNIIMSQPSRF